MCSWKRSHKPRFSFLPFTFLGSVHGKTENVSLSFSSSSIHHKGDTHENGRSTGECRRPVTAKPAQQCRSNGPARRVQPSEFLRQCVQCVVDPRRSGLAFSVNNVWERGQANMQVQMTNRIVLNPYAAKRLATVLNRVVAEYESRFGTLKDDARPQTNAA